MTAREYTPQTKPSLVTTSPTVVLQQTFGIEGSGYSKVNESYPASSVANAAFNSSIEREMDARVTSFTG